MVDKNTLRELSRNLTANPDDYMKSFRKNVFMYIERKDITLNELAEAADISLSTLRSLLYGDANDCHVSSVVKLARALHVSCDELLGSGTISPQTCESLQLTRTMPESFTHFVRWAIHYHHALLHSNKVSVRAIEVMRAECKDNGNLGMNNDFEVMDISDLNDDILPKVFMGIKIPCEHYEPYYYQGDILLLANDRKPRTGEVVALGVKDNMWLYRCREERQNDKKIMNFYSLRDDKKCMSEEDGGFIIGYLVKTVRNMNFSDD